MAKNPAGCCLDEAIKIASRNERQWAFSTSVQPYHLTSTSISHLGLLRMQHLTTCVSPALRSLLRETFQPFKHFETFILDVVDTRLGRLVSTRS